MYRQPVLLDLGPQRFADLAIADALVERERARRDS
jgi:hypothetical protein